MHGLAMGVVAAIAKTAFVDTCLAPYISHFLLPPHLPHTRLSSSRRWHLLDAPASLLSTSVIRLTAHRLGIFVSAAHPCLVPPYRQPECPTIVTQPHHGLKQCPPTSSSSPAAPAKTGRGSKQQLSSPQHVPEVATVVKTRVGARTLRTRTHTNFTLRLLPRARPLNGGMSFAIEVPGEAVPLGHWELVKVLTTAAASTDHAQRQSATQQLQAWEADPDYYTNLQVSNSSLSTLPSPPC